MLNKLEESTKDILRLCSVPSIVSTLFKMGFQNVFIRGIKPLVNTENVMVGPAVTVRSIPIREDLREGLVTGNLENLQAKAFEETSEGSVLVCEAGGVAETAFMGDMVATAFKVKRVEGVVIDGSVNDRYAISKIGLPIYSIGDASLPFNSHRFITDLNVPIGCGGVAIFPGDILVGDQNGVAVIPKAKVREVAEKAKEREDIERFCGEKLKNGAPLLGTYPPNEATMKEFWINHKKKGG